VIKKNDENNAKVKILSKDSEQLVTERKRITALTIEVTRSTEKEENMAVSWKDAKKKLLAA